MTRHMRTILILAGTLGLATLLMTVSAEASEQDRRELRVTGVGEVLATPDMAIVQIGVVREADTAAAALKQNSAAMADIVAALKADGIAARDLQTSGFSIQPKYSRLKASSNSEQNTPQITGYSVRNTLTVRIRDLDRSGPLLDSMVSLGSNSVQGITFGVAEPRPLEDEARRAAIADGRARAELYAAAAGVDLGTIVLISEPQVVERPAGFGAARTQIMEAAVPVEAGELAFSATVEMVWRIE